MRRMQLQSTPQSKAFQPSETLSVVTTAQSKSEASRMSGYIGATPSRQESRAMQAPGRLRQKKVPRDKKGKQKQTLGQLRHATLAEASSLLQHSVTCPGFVQRHWHERQESVRRIEVGREQQTGPPSFPFARKDDTVAVARGIKQRCSNKKYYGKYGLNSPLPPRIQESVAREIAEEAKAERQHE
jgi:hypothetical protein